MHSYRNSAQAPARLCCNMAAGRSKDQLEISLVVMFTGTEVNYGIAIQMPRWSEMEYMIRNWVNWTWLSGDHIVEQHVHNLDVMNWFTGTHPVKAVGFGSRLRRVTGNQYDNFSVDFNLKTEDISIVCAVRSMVVLTMFLKECRVSKGLHFVTQSGCLYRTTLQETISGNMIILLTRTGSHQKRKWLILMYRNILIL